MNNTPLDLGYTFVKFTTAHNPICEKIVNGIALQLIVYPDNTASLSRTVGSVTCTIERFAFPNVNFELFEKEIIGLKGISVEQDRYYLASKK